MLMFEIEEKEMIDHPSHYNMGKYEAIDVIEDWNLGFNLGNTISDKGNTTEIKIKINRLIREIDKSIELLTKVEKQNEGDVSDNGSCARPAIQTKGQPQRGGNNTQGRESDKQKSR